MIALQLEYSVQRSVNAKNAITNQNTKKNDRKQFKRRRNESKTLFSLLSTIIVTSKVATARIPIAKRNTVYAIKMACFVALCANVSNAKTK